MLDAQAAERLYLSSVTVAELMFGISVLPNGRSKDNLTATLDGVLDLFVDRILRLDIRAARRYADLAVTARAAGKGFLTPDGYTAAIVAVHNFVLVSREPNAFIPPGTVVINP